MCAEINRSVYQQTRIAAVLLGLLLGAATSSAPAADINKGAQVYSMHCASCHGPRGVPIMAGSPNFSRSEGMLLPDNALLMSIQRGRNAMPGFFGILKDAEILDVIAYIRTLRQ